MGWSLDSLDFLGVDVGIEWDQALQALQTPQDLLIFDLGVEWSQAFQDFLVFYVDVL